MQVCREAMLSAGGLQHLLQHLHQLLLPIITPALASAPDVPPQLDPAQVPANSGEQTVASSSSTDSKDKLAVAPEDLDTLLAVLEALASADAAADSSPSAQVATYRCLSSEHLGIVCKGITQCGESCTSCCICCQLPAAQVRLYSHIGFNITFGATFWYSCTQVGQNKAASIGHWLEDNTNTSTLCC